METFVSGQEVKFISNEGYYRRLNNKRLIVASASTLNPEKFSDDGQTRQVIAIQVQGKILKRRFTNELLRSI